MTTMSSSQNPTPATNIDPGDAPRPAWPRRILGALAIIGPAFIAGAWQFGPGALTTAVRAGNVHGYSLLWVILLSTLLAILFTDMSVRIGLQSGESIIETAKRVYGKFVGMFAGLGVFVITLIFSVGNAVGTGIALNALFGGPPLMWAIIGAASVVFIVFAKSVYGVLERLLLALVAIMVVGFVLSAAMTSPDWGAAAVGLLVPSIPAGAEVLVVALVGTNFSINAAFYVSYAIREKGSKPHQYKAILLRDTIPGIGAPGILAVFVVLAAVATSQLGYESNTLADLGRALEPVAGPLASTLFAIGFFGAAYSSMTANAMASGTVLSDAIGRGSKLNSRSVKAFILIPLVFGVGVMAIAGGNPVQLIISVQALIVFVAPFVGIVIVALSSRRTLMEGLTNPLWARLAGWFGVLVLLAMSVRLVFSLLG